MNSKCLYRSRIKAFLVVDITGLSVGDRELEGPKSTVTPLRQKTEKLVDSKKVIKFSVRSNVVLNSNNLEDIRLPCNQIVGK